MFPSVFDTLASSFSDPANHHKYPRPSERPSAPPVAVRTTTTTRVHLFLRPPRRRRQRRRRRPLRRRNRRHRETVCIEFGATPMHLLMTLGRKFWRNSSLWWPRIHDTSKRSYFVASQNFFIQLDICDNIKKSVLCQCQSNRCFISVWKTVYSKWKPSHRHGEATVPREIGAAEMTRAVAITHGTKWPLKRRRDSARQTSGLTV